MPRSDLRAFRESLQSLLGREETRPFLCDGDPRNCDLVIVGFNAATAKGLNIWDYWSDDRGLDRDKFLAAYRQRRNIKGVRARLERIVSQIPTGTVETNIYAVPTSRAHKLARRQQVSTAFEFLFQEIRPKVVFAHSTAAISFLRRRCETPDISSAPVEATWQGHRFYLLGRPGPLFRASYEEALQIGSSLAALLGNLGSGKCDLP